MLFIFSYGKIYKYLKDKPGGVGLKRLNHKNETEYIFLLTVLCLSACGNNPKRDRQLDSFYTDKGGFDLGRIPLIKPYEVTSSRENDWIVASTDTSDVPVTIPGTRSIYVIDSVIFVYSQQTVLDYQPVDAAWFVIIPRNHIFHGFKDHQTYLNYINSIGLNKEPKLYDVQEVSQYFNKHDTVNWRVISISLKAVDPI